MGGTRWAEPWWVCGPALLTVASNSCLYFRSGQHSRSPRWHASCCAQKRLSRVRTDNEELRTENARLRAALQLSQRGPEGDSAGSATEETSVFQQTKEAREENGRLRKALEAAEEVNAQLRERLDEAHHMRPSAQQSLASMQRILEDTLAEKNACVTRARVCVCLCVV